MSWQDEWQATVAPNYGTPGLCLVSGNGHQVTDQDGKTYTDLLAGIAVNALGHAHPDIVAAVSDQVGRLGHTSNLYANPPALELAGRLSAASGGKQVLFTNSGTEANEVALKAMRRKADAEDRPDAVVLAFEQSFHGRTAGALALTGQPKHQAGCGPLPDQIVHIPFNDPEALATALASHDVVGIIAEVIQGEGGIHPMSPALAQALTAAQADGVLLAIDEVQTGIGRTGTLWAFEQFGLEPDIITAAKGLGGGMPLGAALLAPEVAALLGPGTHGCTFGGNPMACAAGTVVIDHVQDGLAKRAGRVGAQWVERLQAAGLEPRGMGLLLGIPVPDAAAVAAAMQQAGFLVGQAGPDVVRLAPPLNIPEAELEAAAKALEAAVVAQAA